MLDYIVNSSCSASQEKPVDHHIHPYFIHDGCRLDVNSHKETCAPDGLPKFTWNENDDIRLTAIWEINGINKALNPSWIY
jgi:hypothetical protein